jgi:hypothetical protein
MGPIHSGAQGENGTIVVTLFRFDSSHSSALQNGTIAANNLDPQI